MSPADAQDPAESLRPIVVDSSGRSGSTMMMALLGSSPQVAMDREYPYEHPYFAWLLGWSMLVDRTDWDPERWSVPVLGDMLYERGAGLLGPPPWSPRPLLEADKPGAELGPRVLLGAWREFSAQAAERTRRDLGAPGIPVRYHAEKGLDIARVRQLSPLRVRGVILHRDPRDVWLSIQAFDRARGFHGFGRGPDEDEEAWFERFLAIQAKRIQAMLAERGSADSLLVSYEDLVGQPAETAARLSTWLGVELDPAAPPRDLERHAHHATTASPEASVGRWRRELEPQRRERFMATLGPELRELGYAD